MAASERFQTVSGYNFACINFKAMLPKHQVTQVLSLDFKKTPAYFNWDLMVNGSPLLTLKS